MPHPDHACCTPFLSHVSILFTRVKIIFVCDCKLEWHWFEYVAAYTDLICITYIVHIYIYIYILWFCMCAVQPLKVRQAGLVHIFSWGLASLPFQPQPLESFSRAAVALAESRCHRCCQHQLLLEKLVIRDPLKCPRNHEFSRKAIYFMKTNVDIGGFNTLFNEDCNSHSPLLESLFINQYNRTG